MKFLRELFKHKERISIFAPEELEDELRRFASEHSGIWAYTTVTHSDDVIVIEFKTAAKRDDVIFDLVTKFKKDYELRIGEAAIFIRKRRG